MGRRSCSKRPHSFDQFVADRFGQNGCKRKQGLHHIFQSVVCFARSNFGCTSQSGRIAKRNSTKGQGTGEYAPRSLVVSRCPKSLVDFGHAESAHFARLSRYFGPKIAQRKDNNEWVAERVGFEPTVEFPQHTLSKRAP